MIAIKVSLGLVVLMFITMFFENDAHADLETKVPGSWEWQKTLDLIGTLRSAMAVAVVALIVPIFFI